MACFIVMFEEMLGHSEINVKNAVFMEVESQVIRTNSYIELSVIHIAMKINTED